MRLDSGSNIIVLRLMHQVVDCSDKDFAVFTACEEVFVAEMEAGGFEVVGIQQIVWSWRWRTPHDLIVLILREVLELLQVKVISSCEPSLVTSCR